jgi:hypothetical protein
MHCRSPIAARYDHNTTVGAQIMQRVARTLTKVIHATHEFGGRSRCRQRRRNRDRDEHNQRVARRGGCGDGTLHYRWGQRKPGGDDESSGHDPPLSP